MTKIDINLNNKNNYIMQSDISKSQSSNKKNMKAKKQDDNKIKKKNESSDDDEWATDDEEDEFDMEDYQKFLNDIFPSKFMQEKVNAQKSSSKKKKKNKDDISEEHLLEYFNKMKHNKKEKAEAEDTDESSKDKKCKNKCYKNCKKSKKGKKKRKSKNVESESESDTEQAGAVEDSEDDSEEYDEEEFYSDDEMDDDEAAEIGDLFGSGRGNKFNIIFTLADPLGEDEYDEDEEYDSDSDYNDSNIDSDESDDSDDENEKPQTRRQTRSMSKKKKARDVEHDDEDRDEDEDEISCKKKYKKKSSKDRDRNSEEDEQDQDSEDESKKITDENAFQYIDKLIESMPESYKKNKIVKEHMETLRKQKKDHKKVTEKKEKKQKTKNLVKFKKQLREKNVMNDAKFFKENLTLSEQNLVLRQIEELKEHCDIEKPYRLSLLNANIPVQFKACAYKKLSTLRYMEPGGGEYYKIKNWVDTFMRIPFGIHNSLPLQISDGVEKCHAFMENAKQTLDKAVYGLNDAKLQIMQMVGQWITNPDAVGSAIAIKGPMGTGKTTLVKEGISKILGREFAFIALGGATDSSFLEGHSYTYEGSTWGKIVDILVQCKCMNPVIYFDELDKVSDTAKGEEIIGILTHLTDTSQNSKFHDKYYAELDFDLSRCLFIFSYNDEDKVNPILKDRMYRIQTRGYKDDEKVKIANDYLLPKIREQIKFEEKDIIIPEDVTKYIINEFTDKEDGVRNLKRCLEIIYTKLNLYRLMKPGSNLFDEDMDLDITFPVTITNDIINKLIKKKKSEGNWKHMYM